MLCSERGTDRELVGCHRQTTPGKPPPFIVSPPPEGWLEKFLKYKEERTLLLGVIKQQTGGFALGFVLLGAFSLICLLVLLWRPSTPAVAVALS
jgi:hypothetical protein